MLNALAGARSSRVLALLCVLSSSTLFACSADPDRADEPVAAAPDAGPAPDAETPPDPAQETCDAETARLRTSLDKARDAATNAVLAVKTTACGVRVLTSGPSKLDGTELHRIGSITKTYVAAVILTLAHEGKLSLDDAVSKWVTDLPNGDAITLRQLLDHQSGLFNYTEDKPFVSKAVTTDGTWTPRQLLDVALSHPPDFAPGTSWHYSNTNYVVLGMVAEAAGHATIGALVRARALEPSRTTATFFDGEEPVVGTVAAGFDVRGRDMRAVGPSWAWSAGAMVASPRDLVTWIEKVGSGTFYDAETQGALTTSVATDQSTLRYGLGLMVLDARITLGAGIGYGHGGDTPGYHSQAFYFPKTKLTIVSIVDSDAAPANDITAAALATLQAK